MNERQMFSVARLLAQPLAFMSVGSTVPAMNLSKPVRSLLVASEKPVSRASETRVIDGVASYSEIACIAARPASQFGKK